MQAILGEIMLHPKYPTAKNLILVTLTAVLTLLLVACGGNDSETETPAEDNQAETLVEIADKEVSQAAIEVEQPEAATEVESISEEVETAAEVETVEVETTTEEVAETTTNESGETTADWLEFVSEEYGFTVLMPDEPQPMLQNLDTEVGTIDLSMFMHEGLADGRSYAYAVAYNAVPIDVSAFDEPQLETFFDDSRNGGLQNLNASLVDEYDSPLQGYPGRFVEFAGDDMNGMNWFILAENNLYQIMVLTQASEQFTVEDFAFMDSFTLLETLPQPEVAPITEAIASSANTTPATAQTTYTFGEAIAFDDLIVTVNGVSAYETDDLFVQPQEDHTFLLVDITVQNTGSDTGYFLPISDANITDADGNVYEYSLLVSALSEELNIYEGEIPADTTHQGAVPFEVAENAQGLTLVIDTTSFENGGEVYIPLDGEAAATQNDPQQIATAADANSPEAVLQAVFDAAQSGDFSTLSNLCDPMGENDGDTQQICTIASDAETQDSFVEYFSTGQITGDAAISTDGNQAEVPFLFGPNGQQEETMSMVNRDGQWYLSSF